MLTGSAFHAIGPATVKEHSPNLCPVFETPVIRRISSYPWNKKQQRFSNSKSWVILGITHRKLPRHYRWDKPRINSEQEKWPLTSTSKMTICGNWLSRTWTYFHQAVVPIG